jgi:hypothetical protein
MIKNREIHALMKLVMTFLWWTVGAMERCVSMTLTWQDHHMVVWAIMKGAILRNCPHYKCALAIYRNGRT